LVRGAQGVWGCAVAGLLALGACGDGSGPGDEPAPLRFGALTVATGVSCGLTADGVLYCWGNGNTRPGRFQSTLTFASVSAVSTTFSNYACGLDTSGQPYCWGSMLVNVDGAHNFGPTPVALPTPVPLSSLSAGVSHICGVAASHEAYCWGDFEGGRRGDPLIGFDTSYATFEPNLVGGGLQLTEVAAGDVSTCGLTTGGQAYCWGSDALGQLGDPAAPVQEHCGLAPGPCAPGPVPVAGGHQFTALSGTDAHVCGRDTTGELYCWGLNDSRQVGTNVEPAELCGELLCVKQPALVDRGAIGATSFGSVSAGGNSTCALDPDGAAYCWGDNSSGQLGNGGGSASIPLPVAGDHRFSTIAVTEDHACALTLEGEAYCWGENRAGQLGTGNNIDSNEPVAVVSAATE
jgi:alpha-tubulin suppressor-like RCC1 family protein